MVSPGELRALDQLADDNIFEPEIADSGTVSYPDVANVLDDTDDDPATVLERFATRGLLARDFVSKVHVCPECTTEGMQYTTVCPSCKSAHIIQTVVLEHVCGHVGPKSEFEDGDEHVCPECEKELHPEDTEQRHSYVCNECSEIADIPDDRLWCRECFSMVPTLEAPERVLYRYGLTSDGRQWIDHQKDARQTIAEVLQERRFNTEIDTTATSGPTSRPVHVLAEDSLMNEERIVEIHETPDAERVDEFCAFAGSIGAHPVIVTTSGKAEKAVIVRAESSELTLLAFEAGGTLKTDCEVVEQSDTQNGFFQRLTAALEVPGRNVE